MNFFVIVYLQINEVPTELTIGCASLAELFKIELE